MDKIGFSDENLVVCDENIGVSKQYLVVSNEKLGVSNENLGVSDEIILWVSFKIWVPKRSSLCTSMIIDLFSK